MTYVRDPYDTDEPPCVCGLTGPARTTEEFCAAHGDPAKPFPDEPAPAALSGWKMTITRTLHLIGRHPSAEAARAFASQLLADGELNPSLVPWETAVTAAPLGAPARHPQVTFTNAITSCPTEYERHCYPDTGAAFEAAVTGRPYN